MARASLPGSDLPQLYFYRLENSPLWTYFWHLTNIARAHKLDDASLQQFIPKAHEAKT